jgi:hypothetical protein
MERFSSRSTPQSAQNPTDESGRSILSEGAYQCHQSLRIMKVADVIKAMNQFPISLSIIAPPNADGIVPKSPAVFEVRLANTYDTNGISWSTDEMVGWLNPEQPATKANFVVADHVFDPVSTTVQVSYQSQEGNFSASVPIRVTPPIAIKVGCSIYSYYQGGQCPTINTISNTQLYATVHGVDSAQARKVSWRLVSGVGSVDANGIYRAPLVVSNNGASAVVEAKRVDGNEVGQVTLTVVNRSPFVRFWSQQTSAVGGSSITVNAYANLDEDDDSDPFIESVMGQLVYQVQPSTLGVGIESSGSSVTLKLPTVSQSTQITLSATLPSGRDVTAETFQLTIQPGSSSSSPQPGSSP